MIFSREESLNLSLQLNIFTNKSQNTLNYSRSFQTFSQPQTKLSAMVSSKHFCSFGSFHSFPIASEDCRWEVSNSKLESWKVSIIFKLPKYFWKRSTKSLAGEIVRWGKFHKVSKYLPTRPRSFPTSTTNRFHPRRNRTLRQIFAPANFCRMNCWKGDSIYL